MRSRFSAAAFWLLLLAGAALGACAASDVTLAAAQQEAANVPAGGGRLFYIGVAWYSEPWSENDVVDLASKLRVTTTHYQLVPMIASNVATTGRRYPVADDVTVASLVRRTAEQAGPNDIVFVDISTHGARKMLARKVGNQAPTALPARTLASLFAPLAGRRTIMVISACYSGSLIDDLRVPGRIIITAARADRSSFGCAPDSRHTLFGEAELRAFGQQRRSLHEIFTAITADVARMERERHYTPSEPQVSVSPDVADLYDAPEF